MLVTPIAQLLHDQLTSASIPFSGVSIGDIDDKSTWRVDFDGASASQMASASAIIDAFDPVTEEDTWQDDAFNYIGERPYLKAFALVVLDELNILRTAASMTERTPAQLKQAIKNRLT
jgi:hypothetical protein